MERSSRGGDSVTVLLQGDDIGGTAYWFRWWLDDPQGGYRSWEVDDDELAEVLAEFADALPTPHPGEALDMALDRALNGPLRHREREQALMRRLGRVLLTEEFSAELLTRSHRGQDVEVRITPPPSCSGLPWSLVILRGLTDSAPGRPPRLGRLAVVSDEVPAAFHAGRANSPAHIRPGGRMLRIIDPELDEPGTRLFTDDQRARLAGDGLYPPGARVDAGHLSVQLRDHLPSALLFAGHVTGGPIAGESTAMRLSPAEGLWGGGVHLLPDSAAMGYLTAADLVMGTQPLGGLPGSTIWPMPNRVGIVACNSGADLARREPFGLAMACLNAGAEYAVATRWVLPSDYALRGRSVLLPDDPQPLCDTAAAVMKVLSTRDPVSGLSAALRSWVDDWDAGVPTAHSPLWWGSLCVFSAPQRPVDHPVDLLI